jgi:hypothetical protein
LASMPAFSHAALTVPERAPRGSLSITNADRRRLEKEKGWRGTASLASEEGPSMRAYIRFVSVFCSALPYAVFQATGSMYVHACGR